MFFIILTHTPAQSYCLGYGLDNNYWAKLFKYIIAEWTGTVGNYLFVMISSWFLIDSKFSLKNVFKLWFSVFSISVIIALGFFIGKVQVVSFLDFASYLSTTFDQAKHFIGKKELVYSFFPFYHNIYWFASTYLVYYIVSPFLSKLVKSLNRKEHLFLAVFSFLLVSVMPSLPHFTLYSPNVFGVDVFFEIFFIISYCKIYSPDFLTKSKKHFFIGFGLLGLFLIFNTLNFMQLIPHGNFIKKCVFTKWLIMIAALSIFIGFNNIELKTSNVINFFGGNTFGVYLIHQNFLLYPFALQKIFKIGYFLESKYIILWTIIVVFIVFILSSLIEAVRKKLLEDYFMKIISKFIK